MDELQALFAADYPDSPGCRSACFSAACELFRGWSVKQQQHSSQRKASGIDREVGGEEELDKMKETAVYKWQASIPHQQLPVLPSSPPPAVMCPVRSSNSFKEPGRQDEARQASRILKETASLSANSTLSDTQTQSVSSVHAGSIQTSHTPPALTPCM